MTKFRLTPETMDKYLAKFEGRKLRDIARAINEDMETNLAVSYIADQLSQHRGTAKPRQASDFKQRKGETERAIREADESHPNNNAQNLARIMLAERRPGMEYHADHLAYLIRDMRRKSTSISVGKAPNPALEAEKYRVENGSYRWKAAHGQMAVSVEEADRMFYEYSRHGLDLSQSQMRQRHGLKIWEWHAIKNTLFLYKDANIMSPWTEENTPKEDLQRVIDERMEMKLNDKQRLIESSYNRETINRYKKVIEKDQRSAFATENMLDELNDLMAGWKCKTSAVKRTPDFGTERKWLVVPIADLHIGARVENLKLAPDFSPEQARHNLGVIADKINAAGATDVTLAFMGDLIESFTGMNHANSWHQIEYGMIGAKVIREAMSIIEEFVTKVNNVREILGISGNHDRITASNKEDNRGQVAEIIFYMLNRLYGNVVRVEYEDLIMSRQIDGIQYVLAHGDKKVIREGKQAVLDHGDSKLFNVILTAHLHHRQVIADERTFRWIGLPSVFSGNRYSEENAWNARPGFQTFENDGTGKPIQTDYTV